MEPDFEKEYKAIGRNIAYYRRLRGLTQEELALKVSMSASYLSKIECGNYHKSVSFSMLLAIGYGLEISIEDLLKR